MSNLDNVWNPELLLAGWMSASFMLMTASLLFYHMTRVKSLEMDPRVAGIFAVTLILGALAITITSIYPYYQRIGAALAKNGNTQIKEERKYRIMYTVIACIIMMIELGIALIIVKGSFMGRKN